MTPGQLVASLRKLNVIIHLDEEEELCVEAPKGVLTPELVSEVRNNKVELKIYLQSFHAPVGASRMIGKAPEAESYPLSSSQLRLWLLDQVTNSSAAYTIPTIIEMNGLLDVSCFEHAIAAVVERHESLRTVIREDGRGNAAQWILQHKDYNFVLPFIDVRTGGNGEERIKQIIEEDKKKPFNLASWPLFRVILFRTHDDQYVFYYNIHHIISDGWSIRILYRDVMKFYEAFQKKEKPELPELEIQYKDYAVWQQQQSRYWDIHRNYWLNQFSGVLPTLEMPIDRVRPSVQTYNGYLLATVIDSELTKGMRDLCNKNNCTLFMGLLGVLNVLLYRYTGQHDITVGTVTAGREQSELEDQIGFYVNTLPLRIQLQGDKDFEILLDSIRIATLSAYRHQLYPFDMLVEELGLKRDTSRAPLFDIMAIMQNQQHRLVSRNVRRDTGIIDGGSVSVKVDMGIEFWEENDTLYMRIEFNSDIYKKQSVERFINHYLNILNKIIKDPGQQLDHIEYLTDAEKEQLLVQFNDTYSEFEKNKSVVDIFRDQVTRTPDAIAIVSAGNSMSYRKLDEKSNQLGRYLKKKGVKPGDIVPICIDRSKELIIGILSILKVGAVYVPVDPAYPQERIAYMLDDTKANVVLTVDPFNPPLSHPAMQNIYLDRDLVEIEKESRLPLDIAVRPNDLVYIIYTSGSTGRPKGVMIEHTSIVNLISWHIKRYQVNGASRSTVMAGIGFDACALEIWSALLSGSCLYIIPDDIKLQSEQLVSFYRHNQITHAFVPPALIPGLVNTSQNIKLSLKYVLIGGDRLQTVKTDHLPYILVNQYGPTECTVMVTDYMITSNHDTTYPIGKPLSNTSIYILDKNKNLVPVGVTGEMYIGGIQLSRGYVNKAQQTSENFIKNIFSNNAGDRLYKTGDIAKWLPDGNIEYIGRADDQVKIRGYRIELGEIEYALSQIEGIESAIVQPVSAEDNRISLAAYFVSEKNHTATDLRQQLGLKLPDYMVPGYFIQLRDFPLTPNGKVDRKLLPPPNTAILQIGEEYVAPRNETESKLAAIVASVLNREENEIGIDSNFFDMGANSMSLIRITGLINQTFNKQLKVVSLFSYPNIRSLVHQFFIKQEPQSATRLDVRQESLDDILTLFDKS